MAVSFGDASRFVRIYTHKCYTNTSKSILNRNGERVNSYFPNIHRGAAGDDGGGGGGHRQTKTILIHVEISSRHIILVWCFISYWDGTMEHIGGPSITLCAYLCVCAK